MHSITVMASLLSFFIYLFFSVLDDDAVGCYD